MTRAWIIGLAAAAVLFPTLASAQYRNSVNNEAVCSGPGYGMDPRCVGEQSPGSWSDVAPAFPERRLILIEPQMRRR